MSTFSAAGALPRPGICWMSPHSGTSQPAPGVRADVAHRQLEVLRGVQERRVGGQRQVRLRHADRQLVEPVLVVLADLAPRVQVEDHVLRPVHLPGDLADLLLDRVVVVVDERNSFGCSHASATASARSAAPSPPFEKPSFTSAPNAPASSASFLTSATSSSVSPGRRLTATTHGSPKVFTIPRWRTQVRRAPSRPRRAPRWSRRAGRPPARRGASARARSPRARRPTASSPPFRHTMSKNFSIPMSDPKPDSVIT